MIIILENVRATLKMGRGLSGIIFIWCRGYFLNRETWRVYLEKEHKRGRVLKRIERKGWGFGQKCPFFLLFPMKQRRGGRAPAAALVGGPGRGGSRG